jgi:hypothetical protein
VRVLCVPTDFEACGFFRVLEPARVAREAGWDVTVRDRFHVDGDPHPLGMSIVRWVLDDCDVIVMQRPMLQGQHSLAVQAKRQGIKIVVDMDDDLHAVSKRNTAAKNIDPVTQPWHNPGWATKVMAVADVLTVSTPALRKYGPRKAVVVPNRLPEYASALAPETSPSRRVVGWTGALNVHPDDLQVTGGALNGVDAPVRVVGQHNGVADALGLPPDRVTLGAPWQVQVPAYWKAVAENIGVGIAPLELTDFNRAKSGLKVQEYMTLGIPWVASPTPEYERLAAESHGGVIARTPLQWANALNRLLTDDKEYERRRRNGLRWAARNTLERHINERLVAWGRAYRA